MAKIQKFQIITLSQKQIEAFRKKIYSYYRKHGRHALPWRKTREPYKIFISEIMLQQTNVGRVIPKYKSFIKKFPNFQSLARASFPDVLREWRGLGYNRRAIFLKKSAAIVQEKYGGILPSSIEPLEELPGIGYATASSIIAFAYNKPVVFIETNIRSVFIHFLQNTKNCKNTKISDKEIFPLVKTTLDSKNPREWYCALMDYGNMLKQKYGNPNAWSAHYHPQTPFKASDRYIRGLILKHLIEKGRLSEHYFYKNVRIEPRRFQNIIKRLRDEGFLSIRNTSIALARRI